MIVAHYRSEVVQKLLKFSGILYEHLLLINLAQLMLFEPDQVAVYSEESRVMKDYLSDVFGYTLWWYEWCILLL